MKVLNLYAGIGGNRKLWEDVDVTAIEWNENIAKIYSHFFPNDKMIITDAHEYLRDHYTEFDFIWSSPPCPTHSIMNRINKIRFNTHYYPDMRLYEEILFLKHFYKGLYCVENVISYYDPLIIPQSFDGHYYWANFLISSSKNSRRGISDLEARKKLAEKTGFNLDQFTGIDKRQVLRNCVNPVAGKIILDSALGKTQMRLTTPAYVSTQKL